MMVTQTERKKVGGQSGLESQLCWNRINLSEVITCMAIRHPPSPLLSAASQSIKMSADLRRDRKAHTAKKMILQSTHQKSRC